jgi:hypothetical protein
MKDPELLVAIVEALYTFCDAVDFAVMLLQGGLGSSSAMMI